MSADQIWDADLYSKNARFVSDLGSDVLKLLDPRPGERILDLGCGDGVLTAKIAEFGASVLGIDTSGEMIASARALGIETRQMHAEELAFDKEFDAVFSNAMLHWVKAPGQVIAGVRRTLHPGGRFVGEFGGHGNIAAICVALYAVLARYGVDGPAHSPWYFPTTREFGGLLEAHGFVVDSILLIPRPTILPASMGGLARDIRPTVLRRTS